MNIWEDFATHSVRRVRVVEEVSAIHVVKGPAAGSTMDLIEGPLIVGSHAPADLVLDDELVSRLHCRFERHPVGVHVRDLGSRNGTWLGGHRIVDAVVAPHARVQVGDSLLELVVERKPMVKTTWDGGEHFGDLLGVSPEMQALFAQLTRLLGTDQTTLIRGESGTGKELVARALHQLGPRAQGPFVVVDGACLSQYLADVELFGHVRGAFTDADIDRAGAFERAHGGTLFLDEVGDIPRPVQAKLLRVLDDATVQRIGEGVRRQVDVRVIAATHQPLEEMVNGGGFRADLYHRLATFQTHVPPLRERGEDVERIAGQMLEEMVPGDGRALDALGRALEKHRGYMWPGNVRELRNLVRRVAAFGDGEPAVLGWNPGLPTTVRADEPFQSAKEKWVASFERQYLVRVLDEAGGNVSEAARRAEMSRMHLTRLIAKHGIQRG